MRRPWNSPNISAAPALLFVLALSLLILPIQWVFAWFGAVLFHEMCHYLALRLLGSRVFRIHLSTFGAFMETEELLWHRAFFCALAGPLGSLSLCMLSGWFPRLAVCGLFQAAYNLLPIYPLDGGRALHCLLGRTRVGSACLRILEACVLTGCVILALHACFVWKLGPIPLLLAGGLLLKCGKIPCKLRRERVQ